MPNEGYLTSDFSGAMLVSEQEAPYIKKPRRRSSQSDVYHIATVVLAVPIVPYIALPILKTAMKDDVEEEFNQLVRTWKAETGMLSRLDQKYMHPAYQQIIGMGKAAIPFILRDLKATRGHWFWALRAIARENPVPQESADDIDKVIEAWLEWGRKRGYDI